ncbi:ATP-binding protein [Frigidibacter sp. ROC022]|uniref:ATP-binding protein n=1 Tax=Frigidibacter sp. ROC022 TaxID=2971796 RepID=UPI00215B60B2|nr:ATP-binding protein [Frigidibacter sp. ROC022]MCR8725555.1 ATP-binding protein [Frigidibacter sp. ROC022]
MAIPLLLVSVGAIAAGAYLPDRYVGLVSVESGAVLLGVTLVVRYLARRYLRARKNLFDTVAGFLEHDASPSFTTDSEGRIGYRNPAAVQRFGGADGQTLVAALGDTFASPSAVLYRLQSRAQGKGAAREDVVMRRGHIRLSVHRLGPDGFLWRLEDLVERGSVKAPESIGLPMLTASKSGAVLYMNDAMRRLAGGRETTLDRVFNDLPLRPGQVHEVATAEGGRLRCRVAEFSGPTGRREIYLFPAEAEDDASNWSLADDFPVPMLKLTAEGRVLIANRRARDLLGPGTPEGRSMSELVEGLGRSITDWMGEAARGQGQKQPEVVRVRRDDRELYLQVRLGRVETPKGAELVAVLNDATELKTLEAQFVQSQKMQAIGQLAGGVAHDFNNLLTAISGHCDLLLLRHDATDSDYADLIQISQNANRAAALVGQLLAFSRKQNLQPQVLNLRDVLADHAHLLNRLVGEKVRLELDPADGLPTIRADKRQFEQVMMNLVVNARDAMPSGGTVRITAEARTLTEEMSRDRATVPAGDYVVIRVADEGTGIPPDKVSKIFEPFYTTKKTGDGTGLGLSTAYGIVKQSGGFIFVDSALGKGTEFSLYLPVFHAAPDVAEPAAETLPKPTHPQKGGVVLLVEDEAPVRAFASRALRLRGFTVIEAANAEEALQILEDPDLVIDVFVTDVVMPGLDGPTWVAQALEDRPGVRVVFVSGYAEDSVAEHQARIPNAVFLPKPFSLSELTNTVTQQLH